MSVAKDGLARFMRDFAHPGRRQGTPHLGDQKVAARKRVLAGIISGFHQGRIAL